MRGRGLRRLLRSVPARVAERRFVDRVLSRPAPWRPPLLITGLPRTGTTLVYQYVVHRWHVAYFTQGVGTRPYDPCRTTWREIRAHGPYRSDFRSRFGRSEGVVAPREAGAFWLRFFDIDARQGRDAIDERARTTLRRTVHALETIFDGAPFVNKNVKHVLRIDALESVFPDVHWLVVERDRVDVALSILRARIATAGDARAWFSVRPDDYDAIVDLDPVEQIARQVEGVARRLGEDLARVDPARVHRVDYAAFCGHPEVLADVLGDWIAGVAAKNPPVERFDHRRSEPRNDMEARLVERIRRGEARA